MSYFLPRILLPCLSIRAFKCPPKICLILCLQTKMNIVLLFLGIVSGAESDNHITEVFKVYPGGEEHTFSHSKVLCTLLTYKNRLNYLGHIQV